MTSGKEEFLRESANLRRQIARLKKLIARAEATLDRIEALIREGEEPKPYDVILDSAGNRITVGARVLDEIGLPEGRVTAIISLDGDADDEGRPVAIGPTVKVTFDDGTEDEFDAHWSAKGPEDMDAPFVCLNLRVAWVDDDE